MKQTSANTPSGRKAMRAFIVAASWLLFAALCNGQTSITNTQFDCNVIQALADASGKYIISGNGENLTLSGCSGNFSVNGRFIGKYDPAGNCWMWVWPFPATDQNHVVGLTDLALDGNGNVLMTGMFTGTDTFSVAITKTSLGAGDIYAMKLNGSNGSIAWVATDGTVNSDGPNALAIDNAGNMYISGIYNYYNTNYTMGTTKSSIYLAKFNSAGALQWRKTYEGGGNQNFFPMPRTQGNGLTLDGSGNIYQTGTVAGGTVKLTNSISISSPGGSGSNTKQSGFLLKYNSAGTPQWAQSYSNNNSRSFLVRTDGSGNLYVAGSWHDGTLNFGNAVALFQPDTILANIRAYFLLKVAAGGTAQWARKLLYNLGGITAMTVSDNNNIFAIGSTWYPQNCYVDLEGAPARLSPTGNNNFVIAEYGASGNFVSSILPLVGGSNGGYAYHTGIWSLPGGFRITGYVTNNVSETSILTLDAANVIANDSSHPLRGFIAEYRNPLFKENPVEQEQASKDVQRAEANLGQNYPNPFNPSTTIPYTLAADGPVRLKVYSMLGTEVATLVDGMQTAGAHRATFQAEKIESGVYRIELTAGGRQQSRKMMLLK